MGEHWRLVLDMCGRKQQFSSECKTQISVYFQESKRIQLILLAINYKIIILYKFRKVKPKKLITYTDEGKVLIDK